MALVLKTSVSKGTVSSNLTASATTCASLTQLVEFLAYTEAVGGSSPSGCTINVVSSLNSLGGLISMVLRVNLRVVVE